MWKYIRYIIYISVLTACLTAAYKARDVIIMPYVYDYIHKSTGKDIRFDYFYISPLQHGIVVANINYEDKISVKKTLIKFSFFKILKHIKTPVNYIKSVELSDIGISVDDILKNQNSADENIPASESIPFALPDMPVDIQASGISLIKNSKETKIEGVQMSLSRSSITFSASFSALNSRIAVNSSMTLTRGGLYNTDSSISSEGDINVLAGAKGTIDIFSFDFKQNVNVKKMYYKSFDISGVSSVAEKENGGLKFKANGKFGKIEFLSDASGESSASANIDLSRINKDFGGLLSARFSHKDTGSKINVKAEGIRAFNFDIGSFNLDGEADENGNSSALCDYGGKSVILMNYSPGGNYSAEIVSGGKTGGTFRGNIKTGAFAADMKDADISEMPFMGFLDADPEGKITAEGSIDEHSGKINFVLKDLRTKMIDKTDLYGSVSRNAGMYVFNFYKSDKSVVFNNVIRDGDILSTDFKFVNTDISNVLRTFGYTENKIQGMANGRIKYEKGGTTEFDLNIFDGVIYGNRFKKLDSKGDINMKRVSIEQFILKDNENVTRAYISALFGFTEGSPDSEFHMKLKDVKVAGAKVNGEILFNGKRSGGGEVKGNFSGKGVNISGVSFPDLSADSLISAKRFSLSELKSGNGFSGNFRADFSKDNLSGTLNFRNTDIEGLYSDLSAAVNSTVKLSGSFKNPSAKITAGFKKGTYLGIPFSFDADLTLESEKISVKKLNLISEKTKISVNGVYSKIGELDVVFDKISENLINKFVGFVTPFRGDLSGSGALIQTEGRKHLKMFLTGENTYIKKLKLSDFKSDIEIYKTGMYMSS
ncbi:MAG: hypothetical protein LBR69_05895, partial [Endomicrobium sp.]|nr:hypothetical protein [Endomicrobium sp.]